MADGTRSFGQEINHNIQDYSAGAVSDKLKHRGSRKSRKRGRGNDDNTSYREKHSRAEEPMHNLSYPPDHIEDCDLGAGPLDCVPYLRRIMTHLYDSENGGRAKDTLPNPNYMDKQKDINPRMRGILLNWLVEVHHKFRLKPETLYLCFNLLDRFLSKCFVKRNRLQLCGCVCLWVASKYHEIFSPEMNDFVYISDRAFSKDDLLKMEEAVVKFLDFKITVPTPYSFIQRFIKVAQHNIVTKEQRETFKQYALYIMEFALMDYRCLKYKPSVVSAGAVYIALQTTGYGVWNDLLSRECRIRLDDVALRHFVCYITKVIERTKPHHAVKAKYSKVKTHEVAKIHQLQDRKQKRVRVF